MPAFGLISAVSLSGCLSSSDSQTADPVVVENPVAYVQRTLQIEENSGTLVEDNLADPAAFRPGARLYLKPAQLLAPALGISPQGLSPVPVS